MRCYCWMIKTVARRHITDIYERISGPYSDLVFVATSNHIRIEEQKRTRGENESILLWTPNVGRSPHPPVDIQRFKCVRYRFRATFQLRDYAYDGQLRRLGTPPNHCRKYATAKNVAILYKRCSSATDYKWFYTDVGRCWQLPLYFLQPVPNVREELNGGSRWEFLFSVTNWRRSHLQPEFCQMHFGNVSRSPNDNNYRKPNFNYSQKVKWAKTELCMVETRRDFGFWSKSDRLTSRNTCPAKEPNEKFWH